MDPALMGNLRKSENGLISCGMSLTTNLVQKLHERKFGNSQRSLLSPTGCVKSIPPITENWLRKLYKHSQKNDKSTEDKHETNHINNKYNDTNMNTRKMHNTWACIENAQSSSHFDVGSHALRGSSSESLHVIYVHVRLSLSSPLSLSTSICPSPSSPSSSFSCTKNSTLSSTTWSPCKTCAFPRTRGVTTPTTSTPPSHFGEVQHVKFSKPTQQKPKPICDWSGKPEDTENVFVVKGETSRSHEIDEKGLHEELGSVKPERLSENIRVKHAHDGTGQPVESSSSSTHIVKEQFAPEERDIASFNADDEFNRAIDEEKIDINIPGVPHSPV